MVPERYRRPIGPLTGDHCVNAFELIHGSVSVSGQCRGRWSCRWSVSVVVVGVVVGGRCRWSCRGRCRWSVSWSVVGVAVVVGVGGRWSVVGGRWSVSVVVVVVAVGILRSSLDVRATHVL